MKKTNSPKIHKLLGEQKLEVERKSTKGYVCKLLKKRGMKDDKV